MGKELSNILSVYDKATGKIKSTLKNVLEEQSFVEFDALIGGANEFGEYKGEGILSGIAQIGDTSVAVIATNPEVFDGGISRKGAEKIARIIDKAIAQGLPIVSFIDTAGARILEGVEALSGYALILSSYAKAHMEVPVIIVNCNKNFGMLTFLSGYSDMFIAYESCKIASSSPALVAAFEKSGAEKSDAKTVAAYNGSITNIVKDDAELKALLESSLSIFDSTFVGEDDPNRVCAKLGSVKSPLDVVKAICDTNSVIELRSTYATDVITAFARLDARPVGIISINGKIDQNIAFKMKEFMLVANVFNLPIITLINCTGVVVDGQADQSNLMRAVSEVTLAYSLATSSKIALVTGSAVGLAYSAFASKYNCDYSFAWETANVAPLESSSAARLFYGAEIAKAGNDAKAEKKFAKVYEDENSVFTAAEKGCFDNVIHPEHSRQYLIAALRTL